jgi:hypothetical protein
MMARWNIEVVKIEKQKDREHFEVELPEVGDELETGILKKRMMC